MKSQTWLLAPRQVDGRVYTDCNVISVDKPLCLGTRHKNSLTQKETRAHWVVERTDVSKAIF